MQPLDVPRAIEERRSVKHFHPDPIAPEMLDRIVELTLAAPSSWNLQPWRIVLVTDEKRRRALHEVAFRQPQVLEAPVTFVFAVDLNAWERDIEPMIETARARGAWPDAYCEIARQFCPQGQHALAENGLLREYAVKDAMIAATHTALAAQSLGLGSTFMNGFLESGVKEVIGAKDREEIAIAVLLPIGHPKDVPMNPGRFPREHCAFVDRLTD
ncbi:MAG: nitroreductase family protein [Planctomycetota bacterium]